MPADRAPRPGQGRVPLAMVVVLGALSAFAPLSLDLYLPGLPGLADSLDTSASAAQLTLTSCLLGLAVGQVLSGPWSDAVGRRRPLVLGVAAYIVASFACAFAPSVTVLIIVRFLQGVAGAAGIVISRAVVRDVASGPAAARLFAALLLVNGGAPLLAPVVGGQLLRVTDWRGSFVVLALVGVVILVGTLLFVPESHPLPGRRTGGLADTLTVFHELLAERRFTGCALATGLALAAMFAYIAGSPFVLQGVYGLSPAQFSAVFAVNASGILVAAPLSARLVARVGARAVLGAGLLMGAAGGVGLLVVVLTGGVLVGVLLALFLVVASVGVVVPSGTTMALEDHPTTAGSASALLGLAQYALGALVAPLVGVAGGDTAVPMAVTILVCGLGAVAAFRWLVRPGAAAT